MNRIVTTLAVLILSIFLCSCSPSQENAHIIATTLPVYDFTSLLCSGTDITVGRLITEDISCLHNYTLQTSQMRAVENAQIIVQTGTGLEDFLADLISQKHNVINASAGVITIHPEHDHLNEHHHHDSDPHIWLSPVNARLMAKNICRDLCTLYPNHSDVFESNLAHMEERFDALEEYAETQLSDLSCRKLVTFHDGFSYMADTFNLSILHAIEEESGSEASAAELIELIKIVTDNKLNAVFTERNGSTAAAEIVAAETDVSIYQLDMAISGDSYFEAMYHNIDTLKEALG